MRFTNAREKLTRAAGAYVALKGLEVGASLHSSTKQEDATEVFTTLYYADASEEDLEVARCLAVASSDAMSEKDLESATDVIMRISPESFCRHCLRPVVDKDDALVDDFHRDRHVCFRAADLTHHRGSKDDLPKMLGKRF